MAKHHPDLIMCRKQPGIAIGRLCEKCDGKCVICDSYVRYVRPDISTALPRARNGARLSTRRAAGSPAALVPAREVTAAACCTEALPSSMRWHGPLWFGAPKIIPMRSPWSLRQRARGHQTHL